MADPQTLPQLVRAKYPGQYDDLSDTDLDAKVRAKYPGVYDDIPKPSAKTEAPPEVRPGTGTALTLAGVGASLPKAANWALELATNPDAWKTGKIIGETVGGVTGMVKAGPVGAATGMYVGGKAGWRLTNAAQRVATPIANALTKVTPYAQTLATLSGAQGVNDLAQMADPTRRDIGVLGVGSSVPDTEIQARLTASKPSAVEIAQAKELIQNGMAPLKAISQVANGDRVKYGQLVTAVR